MTLTRSLLVAATVTTGLSAGLFNAFSVAVMPGLARVDDRAFVETMRAINVAILNGWFAVVFVGPVLLIGAGVVAQWGDGSPALPWTVAAGALYAATLAVTGGANVPRNVRLDAPPPGQPPSATRAAFERGWVRWNLVRTVTATAAFAALVIAVALVV